MKKLIVILSIMVFLLAFNVNAKHKSKSEINNECQAFGFNFGVSEWKWEKKGWWQWKKEWVTEGDTFDTSVAGTHTEANWDVGILDDFGATGIIVKSGKDHYAVSGVSGTVTENKPIEHITFCLKPQCGLGGPPGG